MTDIAIDQYADLARSVKKDDYDGVIRLLIPLYRDNDALQVPFDLPGDPLTRDAWLRASPHYEALWACSLGIAISRIQAWDYHIDGNIPLRVKRAQELLLHADMAAPDGGGWVNFIGKVARDYLTTDNGAFIEIERYGREPLSRIKAIHHLDSARCRRTGDPMTPIIYMDMAGREHEMAYYQVISLVDMPSSDSLKYGQGFCAARRAWRKISQLAAIERYLWEKVAGGGFTEVEILQGVNYKSLNDAMSTGKAERQGSGLIQYMGKLIVPVPSDIPVNLVTIPLKSVPDGFDIEKERQEATIVYSDSLGIDPQDIRPLTGQAMGTGAQSQVLDEKQAGKGLASFRKALTHAVNMLLLDEETTFAFEEDDLRDEERQAAVRKARAETRQVMVTTGEIVPAQALQMAVDDGDAPKEFLAQDQTTNVNLGDEEKPEDQPATDADMPAQEQGQQEEQPAAQQVAQKQSRVQELLERRELRRRAEELARQVGDGE